jgi:hypothetical protein
LFSDKTNKILIIGEKWVGIWEKCDVLGGCMGRDF